PVTMTAGLEAMKLLTPPAFDHLAQLGDRLRNGLREVIARHSAKAQVKGQGSLVSLILSDREINNYRDLVHASIDRKQVQALHHGLLNRGVLMVSQGGFLLSTPMTFDDIDMILNAVGEIM